jgi:hypothetical protein
MRTLLKALLCARARVEAASKQPPLFASSGFAALRAGRQPNGDKLKNPNFLAPL